MKRYICAALAAALLAPGMWAVGARAQDDAPPPPPAPEQSERPHQDGGNGDRMKKRLALTDEQQAKFSEAMKAHGDAMKAQGEQIRDAVKKLAEEIKAKASDDDLLAGLTALKAARKATADENEKFEATLASFLTPTQRAKMAVGFAMMMKNRREGERGRKGGDDRGGDHQGGGDRGGQGGDHDAPQGGDGQ